MSQINKDTIITQCANGYRMVTGTSNPIKYGELGTLISTLSNGVTIGDITYNNDGTITVTEDDGTTTHTLATTYTNGVLTALTYDGNSIALTYDANGNLTVLGDTPIDVSGYTGQEILDNTVKFVVEDNTYQIVSVNAGAAIAAVTEPSVQGFAGWLNGDGEQILFPYTPAGDETLTANILTNYGFFTASANDLVFRDNNSELRKTNSGEAVCGMANYYYNGSWIGWYICMSQIASNAYFGGLSGIAATVNYAGHVWYVCCINVGHSVQDTSGLNRYTCPGKVSDLEVAALQILNACYGT